MKRFAALLCAFLSCISIQAAEQFSNTPVAIVGTQTITNYDVKKLQYDFSITGKSLSTEQALMLSIRQSLEKRIADQQNIRISDPELQAALWNLAQENGLPNISALINKLKTQNLSIDDFMAHLKQDLISERLRMTIVQTLFQPSATMVDQFIKQTQGQSNTLFFVREEAFVVHNEQETEQAKEKAQKIYDAVQQKHSTFEQACQDLSGLAPEGLTHTGWIPAAPLVSSLQKSSEADIAVPALYPPIQTGNVIHLLYITEKKQAPTPFQPVLQKDIDVLRINITPLRNEKMAQDITNKLYRSLAQGKNSIAHVCDLYPQDNQSLFPSCHYGWLSLFTPVFNDEKLTQTILEGTTNTMGWLAPIRIPTGWALVHIRAHITRPISREKMRVIATKLMQKQEMDRIYTAFLKGAYDKTYIFIFPHAIQQIDDLSL